MMHLKIQRDILLTTVFIFSLFSFFGSADASKWYIGSDAEFLLDVTLSYGTGVRVSDRDDEMLADEVKDDSNRNFDQWDFINNKVTALADVEFIYKNVGVFLRPKAFYDYVYMTNNSNDGSSNETNNALAGGMINQPDEWADEVEDVHGLDAEILDAFAYANFRIVEVPFDLRVGRQVIAWGESTYIPGMNQAQAPMDISAATAVGTEVKEIFLPTGAVYIQTGIGDMGLRGYYQWEWEKSKFFEGGTFFSSADMLDEIKAPILAELGPGNILSLPRLEDEEARDDGQYGVAVSYMLPWALTEITGYYLNYHEKNQAILDAGIAGYRVLYPEDIKLYGFTVSSVIGDTQVGVEVTYRDDIVFLDPEARTMNQGGYLQAQVGFTYLKSPGWFNVADRIIVSGEAAYGAQKDLKGLEGRPEEGAEGREEEGFKYVAVLNFDWFQVLARTDFGFNVKYSEIPKGNDYLKAVDFQENKNAVSAGVDCTFNDAWKFDLTYENRLYNNDLADRDTLAFKISYSF